MFNSRRLAYAKPCKFLVEVSKRIGDLYLPEHAPVDADVIYTEAMPLRVNGEHAQGDFFVPMATTEGSRECTSFAEPDDCAGAPRARFAASKNCSHASQTNRPRRVVRSLPPHVGQPAPGAVLDTRERLSQLACDASTET